MEAEGFARTRRDVGWSMATWLVAMLATTSVAFAQVEPATVESDATSAEARASSLIEEGVALRLEGDEHGALSKFEQAYELLPSPRALAQRGLAEKSLRQYIRAEQHLNEALQTDDAWVEENREALALASELVAKQLGWVVVTSDVPGATVFVDGRERGAPAERIRVQAGDMVVGLEAPGFQRATADVTVGAGEQRTLALVLARQTNAPPVQPLAPPIAPPPDDGSTQTIVENAWAPWIIGAAATSAVATGLGIAFGARSLQLKSDRDDVCPEATCNTISGVELDDEARTMATASTISFIVGGVAAATAVSLWILEPDDGPVAVSLEPTWYGRSELPGGVLRGQF